MINKAMCSIKPLNKCKREKLVCASEYKICET